MPAFAIAAWRSGGAVAGWHICLRTVVLLSRASTAKMKAPSWTDGRSGRGGTGSAEARCRHSSSPMSLRWKFALWSSRWFSAAWALGIRALPCLFPSHLIFSRSYHQVEHLDSASPKATLLLCWPDLASNFAFLCLSHFRGPPPSSCSPCRHASVLSCPRPWLVGRERAAQRRAVFCLRMLCFPSFANDVGFLFERLGLSAISAAES